MAIAAMLAVRMGAFLQQRAQPGTLTIHCAPAVCDEVAVTKESVPELSSSTSATGTWQISSISHGPYSIAIRFRDGRTLTAEYYHLDAGERKRVDIFIARPAGATVSLRCTGYEDGRLIGEKMANLATPGGDTVYLSGP